MLDMVRVPHSPFERNRNSLFSRQPLDQLGVSNVKQIGPIHLPRSLFCPEAKLRGWIHERAIICIDADNLFILRDIDIPLAVYAIVLEESEAWKLFAVTTSSWRCTLVAIRTAWC
jgi:hypothetical protein